MGVVAINSCPTSGNEEDRKKVSVQPTTLLKPKPLIDERPQQQQQHSGPKVGLPASKANGKALLQGGLQAFCAMATVSTKYILQNYFPLKANMRIRDVCFV